MTMSFAECQKHADLMSEFADEYLAEHLAIWKDDETMTAMVYGDHADYRAITVLLRAGTCHLAFNKAQGLDTAARDILPDYTWYAMLDNNRDSK